MLKVISGLCFEFIISIKFNFKWCRDLNEPTMTEEITKLKGMRNVYRRHLKNLETEVQRICVDFDALSEENVIHLTTLRDNYEKKLAEARKLDDNIVSQYGAQEDLENELADILVRNDHYNGLITKMNHYIKKTSIANTSGIKSEYKRESIEKLNMSSNERPSIKLPKIVLEQFDGKVQNWRSFWDRFVTSIDNKEYLSDVDKFNYLLGLLDDDAKDCVSGLTLSAKNYAEAKEILNDRYGNPQVVISAHMEALVKLPVVKSLSNITQLRKMYDQIEISVRNLESLDIKPESYGSFRRVANDSISGVQRQSVEPY